MRYRKLLIFRQVIFVLIFILSAQVVRADHLKGGWIKYVYDGTSGGKITYTVSFYQYSACNQPDKVDNKIYLSIYDAGTSTEYITQEIPLTSLKTEIKSDFGPCFNNPPTVCYLVAEYTMKISVPVNDAGYTLAVQRCCRIAGIENVPNSNTIGLTYTVTIPGSSYSNDNSPVFSFDETVAICYNSPFSFDFSAVDPDHDSLVYSLCSGLTGGSQDQPVVMNPPAPPYRTIPYISPYSGINPLGKNVNIDPKTGILSGIAPAEIGTYVVAVCVDEYRNGTFIAHTRKELHLDVADCRLGGAELNPSYITCDGFNFTFSNNVPDNPNYSYYWDFGVTSTETDTSTLSHPTYIYPDTGTYTVKLKVKSSAGCEDSAQTEAKIYPGFTTDFSINGSCIDYPYNFKDLSTTKYGVIDSWRWNFGDTETSIDTIQNPEYKYLNTGEKTVSLISTNSKGCVDTATKILQVSTGPDLSLKFNDTLICSIDTLQLKASSTTQGAVFSWSPFYNIISPGSDEPLVYPKQTTNYALTVSYKGCVSQDSVLVNVTDQTTLSLPNDTTICQTDSMQLLPVTNALYFSWTPAQGLSSSTTKQPFAAPLTGTTYSLLASIGKCTAQDAIKINVVPYPSVNVSDDAQICYGSVTQLNADIKAAYFEWSPANSLLNPNTLTPVAGPQTTTEYVLKVTDTLGCPKAVYDSVLVIVLPRVQAFAGNDTNVVRSQPLQLHASGGTNYHWFPASDLNNSEIADPVATFTDGEDTVIYHVKVTTAEGCSAADSVKIYIFETVPQAFIPTAFTPNGDGKNDIFRPILAGLKEFNYFTVYNRWGQQLYSTATPGEGWNGVFDNKKQPSGTYIFVVKGIDYTGKPYFKKGTFVLIR